MQHFRIPENNPYLSVHEILHNNKSYYMVTRGNKVIPRENKKPDAIIIVATVIQNGIKKLVVTSEYRPVLQDREISFPAGLIDKSDYKTDCPISAAMLAAKREFFEETGLELEITEVSPINLYSSSGITDESTMIIFGNASGEISKKHCEPTEDIETFFCSQKELVDLISNKNASFSKVAYPFFWSFAKFGFN